MYQKSLCDLEIGRRGRVKKLLNDDSIKRRLLDLGLTNGTYVESILKNYGGDLTAYMIKGSLIAIRDDDARKIIIEVA